MSFNPAKLRACPECGGGWPSGPEYALRGCGWLHGLPRKVSPSNNEILIHDGAHGRDRFLQLEVKGPRETWPPAAGQLITLRALSRQANWSVRVLRGVTTAVDLYSVTSEGIAAVGIRTHADAIRGAIARWLEGSAWTEAESAITSAARTAHTHGWARVDGVWSCIQDHYAVGHRPDTSCGATLPQEGTAA